MTLASSGTMSIGGTTTDRSINLELGRSATATSSMGETDLRTLAGVASGAISMSDFYGKSAVTVSLNTWPLSGLSTAPDPWGFQSYTNATFAQVGCNYAQKVDTNGMIEWTPNGIGVFVSWLIPQLEPQICSDGAGGAIITWEDYRNYADSDIYAQRVDTNGAKKWASQGIPICTEYDEQYRPQICSDENGGAIITWIDFRNENIISF